MINQAARIEVTQVYWHDLPVSVDNIEQVYANAMQGKSGKVWLSNRHNYGRSVIKIS